MLPRKKSGGRYEVVVSGVLATEDDLVEYLNSRGLSWFARQRSAATGRSVYITGTIEQLEHLEGMLWDLRHGPLGRCCAVASRKVRLDLGRISAGDAHGDINRIQIRAKRQRAAERYERNFGAKAAWIREQPCDACGHAPPSDPSHHPSVGAGGTKKDLIPHCRSCHARMHARGVKTVQREWKQRFVKRTAHYESLWKEKG